MAPMGTEVVGHPLDVLLQNAENESDPGSLLSAATGGLALIRRIACTSLSVLSDILTASRPALLAEESEWVPLPFAQQC